MTPRIGERVQLKATGEFLTVKDVRLDGALIVVEDEYGAAINLTPDLIERLGYKATVDRDGYVTDFEDEEPPFENREGQPEFNGSFR
jgi:hypothetical protein